MSERLSIVMPVYNEEEIIVRVVEGIYRDVIDRHPDCELILVDDASTDATGAILDDLAASHPELCVIHAQRNGGHGASVRRGLDAVSGRWILQLDADGQMLSSEIELLWQRRDDCDLIMGYRVERQDPRHRLILSLAVHHLTKLLTGGRGVRDVNVPFKLFRAGLWEDVRELVPQRPVAPSILLVQGALLRGWRVQEIPVTHRPRSTGATVLRPRRLAGVCARATLELIRFHVAVRRLPRRASAGHHGGRAAGRRAVRPAPGATSSGRGDRFSLPSAVSARVRAVPRRELLLLLSAMGVGLALRLAYVILTRGHRLAGDEIAYSQEGAFIAHGRWFWGTIPYGIAHATAWKAPGYPLWVGLWCTLLGEHPDRVFAVQALLGPLNIGLAWLLGRRLFGARVAVLAAWVLAVYPMAWQYEERMYSEALAVPLALLTLHVVLERPPSRSRAAWAGLLLGVSLLVRPSSALLFAGVAVAWWLAAGWRRGTAMLALSVLVAALAVAPWTVRNAVVLKGFVPVSVQDAAAYGTFNDVSAHDRPLPWAWRAVEPRDADLFNPRHPLAEPALEHALERRALHYIGQHPASLADAFFWNGLSRLWDVRHPARALDEVPYEGRTRSVAIAGLAMYYVLLPLALLGLWRLRRRLPILLPVLAVALAASVVYTADGGTRYRAPLEPLIVVLACAALSPLARPSGGDRLARESEQRDPEALSATPTAAALGPRPR